jgi:hypothetical protein
MTGGISLSGHASTFFSKLWEPPATEIIALLSLGLVIFHGYSASYFSSSVCFLALPVFLYRPLLQHWLPWALIAAVSALVIFHQWYSLDNHKFLLFYWVLALALAFSLSLKDQKAFLDKTARFLIVFVMSAAVVQKTLHASYLDASFFEFTLLTDERFQLFMAALSVDRQELGYNREVISWLQSAYLDNEISKTLLKSSPYVHTIAFVVTWWDYLVQCAVAVAFLIGTRVFDLLGHILLLVFIVTTYLVAPVIGFGWTLSILGYTLSVGRSPKIALCYLATFPMLTIYDLPWTAVI